ncbi:O-fucosyltransferase family protein [Abeliophyllum distichum]|uniref:O-fucosyltransferase family protein n=1 Tax=Abeliophyllum distichum TaxID=126358 RepID=A0ABD1VP25_9LAMI
MMERESSSDEEDDRENLISQNDTVKPPHRSTFEIGDFRTRLSNSTRRFDKRYLYLFAVFLPLFILILYFTIDLKNLFQTHIPILNNPQTNNPLIVNRMRESELRALYLLKQQQSELLKLWNYSKLVSESYLTAVNNNSSVNLSVFNNNANHGAPALLLLEDLKSGFFSQISLNKKIQEVLLSVHENGDFLGLNENYTDPSVAGWTMCRKGGSEVI